MAIKPREFDKWRHAARKGGKAPTESQANAIMFGVRAVDTKGHHSPAGFPVPI